MSASILGLLPLISLWMALDGDVFSISFLGVSFWTTVFVVSAGLVELIPRVQAIADMASKFSALAFLAFLYHHQILYVLRRSAHWQGNFETLLYLSISDMALSLVAAHFSLRCVNKIRMSMFDPLMKVICK